MADLRGEAYEKRARERSDGEIDYNTITVYKDGVIVHAGKDGPDAGQGQFLGVATGEKYKGSSLKVTPKVEIDDSTAIDDEGWEPV